MPCSKQSALDLLLSAHAAGRLAHAHLFTGPAGCGKTWLARSLAANFLGCESDALLAHPDAHFLQPESKSRRILIDQIRSLEQVIQRKPFLASGKVAIIHDADRLQPNAANAFLKTLEEPPPSSLIILTSSLPEAILETVLSRCLETPLLGGTTSPGPEGEQAIAALETACLNTDLPPISAAFQLTRTLQEILASIRERITEEHTALLKQESAKYKNATGGAEWLEEREGQVKALSESAALRERERLLGALLHALGGALLVRSGGQCPHPTCQRLAQRFSTSELLARLDALHTLQQRLALNVNEALALETGMLDLILGPQ